MPDQEREICIDIPKPSTVPTEPVDADRLRPLEAFARHFANRRCSCYEQGGSASFGSERIVIKRGTIVVCDRCRARDALGFPRTP